VPAVRLINPDGISMKTKKPLPKDLRKQKAAKLPPKLRGREISIPSWALPALLVITAAMYLPAVFNGFVHLDDNVYILENTAIREFSLSNIREIFTSFYFANYHPLTSMSYLMEYSIFGPNPMVFHLLNVLLHLVNTYLVFRLAGALGGSRITALAVAALFALHPMHVESVAWVSERKDVLYTAFYLLALLTYLRYSESVYRYRFYIYTLLLFVASLLSKSAAVTLPLMLIAIDLYRGRKVNRRMLLEKVPLLALSAVFGVLALLSQQAGLAVNEVSQFYSVFDRIFLTTYALSFYLVKAVVPFGLCVMHYYPNKMDGLLPWEYYASLPCILMIVFAVLRRTAFRRELLFGFGFFLIALAPMLQIISVGPALTAERYTYVSYIGLFFIAGQWLAHRLQGRGRNIAFLVFGVFLLVCSILTFNRIGVWKDSETLLADVIKKHPDNHIAYWVRANISRTQGEYAAALPDYNQTLRCKPDFLPALKARSEALMELEDYRSAIADLNLAISLDSADASLFTNRSKAQYETGNLSAALLDCERALTLDSASARAYNNRSLLRARAGDLEGGLSDINKALHYGQGDAESYGTRANILFLMQDLRGSLEDYGRAIELKPDKASLYFNRGYARLSLSDSSGACHDWQTALQMNFRPAEQALSQHCQ
jgi:protein O-mannosyl-transferase